MATLDEQLKAANLPVLGTAIEGTTVLFSRDLTPAEQDTYESIVNPVWYDKEQFRKNYQNTIDNLKSIENAPSMTNAQALQAIQFIAKTVRLILRFIAFNQ